MKITTDNTARVVVLLLCLCIVIMRLISPGLPMDGYTLGALGLAALIAIAPMFCGERGGDPSGGDLRPGDISLLHERVTNAGLRLDGSRDNDAYATLRNTRPVGLALAGARATLGLRLKALTEQAKLDSHDADAERCLDVLNTAGITTREQYIALKDLLRLLKIGAREDSPECDELLGIAIGVIEMLDGTLG